MVAHCRNERDAVQAAKRMVGSHKNTLRSHQIINTLQFQLKVKIGDKRVDEIDTLQMAVFGQNLVDVVLMQQLLNLAKQPVGHVFHQLRHLSREDFPQIDEVVFLCLHKSIVSQLAAKLAKRGERRRKNCSKKRKIKAINT